MMMLLTTNGLIFEHMTETAMAYFFTRNCNDNLEVCQDKEET